jgi:hypothetical protein
MFGEFEAAKDSFHLLIAPVHPDRELGDPDVDFGKPDFHMCHPRFEIAGAASDLANIGFQVSYIRLNAPKHFEDKLIRRLWHHPTYR